MRPQEIKAVVFDLDDTLVSSRFYAGMMRPKVIRHLQSMGFPQSILDPNVPAAVNVLRARAMLCASDGSVPVMEFDANINALLLDIELSNLPNVRPILGCLHMISELKDLGVRIGVLTRSSRIYAEQVLKIASLERLQRNLVCRDDFPLDEAKPHPKAMERVAASLGQDASECVLVGDHILDLQCAREAGAAFVGVLTGTTDEESWRQADCRFVLKDVSQLMSLLRCEGAGSSLKVRLEHNP
jgi:phosphoglycolate phosphatase